VELYENQTVYNSFKIKAKDLSLVVVDEASMVSEDCLKYLVFCLDETIPNQKYSILLVGDIFQCFPVAGKTLCGTELIIKYSNFVLTENIRHLNCSFEFKKILHNVRRKCVDSEDLELLNTRCLVNMMATEREKFKDALIVCQLNADVDYFNNLKLESIKGKLFNIRPQFYGNSSGDIVNHEFSNLMLKVGAKVVLTQNLNVSNLLVNGLSGVVVEVVENRFNKFFPQLILIQFDDDRVHDGHPFPVFSSREKLQGGITVYYYPLKLFYSTSIYKIQGQTINKLVVKLGPNEIFRHSTYTCLSRVRKLSDIVFVDEALTFNRFNSPPLNKMIVSETIRLGMYASTFEKYR